MDGTCYASAHLLAIHAILVSTQGTRHTCSFLMYSIPSESPPRTMVEFAPFTLHVYEGVYSFPAGYLQASLLIFVKHETPGPELSPGPRQ